MFPQDNSAHKGLTVHSLIIHMYICVSGIWVTISLVDWLLFSLYQAILYHYIKETLVIID